MIDFYIIKALEITDNDSRLRCLRQYSDDELQDTYNELLEFKDRKKQYTYPEVIESIKAILNKRETEVINVQ